MVPRQSHLRPKVIHARARLVVAMAVLPEEEKNYQEFLLLAETRTSNSSSGACDEGSSGISLSLLHVLEPFVDVFGSAGQELRHREFHLVRSASGGGSLLLSFR